jgi:hypothetical protein
MENKVTLKDIESKIKASCYMVLPDGKTTICMLSLENGYTIKGLSACVDPANFDFVIGRQVAYDDAVRQIWPLEGYLLAERMYQGTKSLPANEMTEDGWVTNQVGKKIYARFKGAQKPRAAKKSVNAPYGYKKDGTPKKRPGRPAK